MDPFLAMLLGMILMLSAVLVAYVATREKCYRASPVEPDWKAIEAREQIRRIEEFQAEMEEARNRDDVAAAIDIARRYVSYLEGLDLGTYAHTKLIRQLQQFIEGAEKALGR